MPVRDVRPSLPALRSQPAKYAAGLACALFCALLYVVSNRWHGPPAQLPLTAIDAWVPFLPFTGWWYASSYLLLGWAFVVIDGLDRATRLLYALAAVQLAAAIVFVAYPVVYPRELAVLPPDTWPVHAALVSFWHTIDTPANCLPSLHVTTGLLSLAAFLHGRPRRHLPVAVLIAVLSIASTMTFKQHYLADLVAGAVLSWIAYRVFFVWIRVGAAGAAGTTGGTGVTPGTGPTPADAFTGGSATLRR